MYPYEKVGNIVNYIQEIYSNRGGSQADVAMLVNEKNGTSLTTEDVASVTQQLNYWHTVKRSDEKTVIIFLNETFRKHIE